MFAPGMFVNPAGTTPEDIARKRAEIAAMMPRFGNARYVGEGLGQLFAGIGLGRQQAALDKQEQAGRQGAEQRRLPLTAMRGTAQPGSFTVLGTMPVTPAQSVADDAMAALGKTPMRPYRDAIASIESAGSGDYSAVGPTHPTMGRALGRYQVMEANIGPWSKEALGREVTPEEFLANPQLQDAIFDHKFGGYVQQYGPEGAAQAWFAGPGGVGKMDRRDRLGTSVADYTQKFSGALGNSPQTMAATIPVQDLMALATDPWQPAEVRQQAQAMLDQQQQLNDPAYAMGLEADRLAIEKARAELAQMGQPQPIETLRERQALASAAGLQPGTPEYQSYILTGSVASNANLPAEFQSLALRAKAAGLQEGTPEYQAFMRQGADGGAPAAFTALDMQANAAGFEDGSPEYKQFMATRGAGLAAQATAEGKAAGENMASAAADLQSAQNALDMINSLRFDPNRPQGTGKSSWFNWIPGSAGYDYQNKVDQVKSGAFLVAIDALRGMGALSNTEGQAATSAITRLDTATSEKAFLEALADYEKIVRQGYDRAASRVNGGKPAAEPQGELSVGTVEDGWEYIGGDPSQPESWRKVQK